MFFIFSSCGVKGPPVSFPETVIDSYVRGYTDQDMAPEMSSEISSEISSDISADKNDSKKSVNPPKTP